MAKPLFLQCADCGHQQQQHLLLQPNLCERCHSAWLEASYDYGTLRSGFLQELLRGLPGRPFNLWRYLEVLPVESPQGMDLDLVGGTPLRPSRRYTAALRLENEKNCQSPDGKPTGSLYIKDERYGPTNSFKDRQAALSVAAMLEAGVHEAVIASTGNAAVAYAAACARAGIKLWVFMTSMVPPEKLREVALYGAEVVKVSGTYDQTKQIAAEFARRRDLPLDRGARSLPALESMKTIAYEIVEQLGWKAPDWYVQSVSGGLGPLGVYHGFRELHAMGLIERVPALAILQAEGCAPMVKAFRAGRETAEAVIPETRIAILSTGDPGAIYTCLRRLTQLYGGAMESVSDEEAYTSMCTLARTEGLSVEPATAVAFAGYEKLVRQGTIRPGELVAINCTGHTFPVEKHILDERGFRSGVDVELEDSQSQSGCLHPRQEGLHAALEYLDEHTRTVLIIDDNPDDAHLIRRFLEKRKAYRVFHAQDGWDGLAQARQRLPDLIVLDLMMPEMDGFGVLEELKYDRRTRRIPVIVVSAKDISREEQQRLDERIKAVYQKGSLPAREFVDQVVEVLELKDKEKRDGL